LQRWPPTRFSMVALATEQLLLGESLPECGRQCARDGLRFAHRPPSLSAPLHRNLELCKTLKTTTEQFSLFSTEQFGGRRIKSGTRGKPPTPGAGRRHTGVGAISRCPRIEKASMYHVLHATSEEPPRISRSCLGWVRRVLRSCDDATGRITALCATHGNM
jgi:hypothetical protein